MNLGFRWVLLSLLSLAFLTPGSSSQEVGTASQESQPGSYGGFEGRTVSRIDIAVRPSEDVAAIRALIRQEAGQPFSIEAIKSSVTALQQTGKFTQIQVSLEPQAAGLQVLFILQPAYDIGLVSFPAPRKLSLTRVYSRPQIFRRLHPLCPTTLPTKKNLSCVSLLPKGFSPQLPAHARRSMTPTASSTSSSTANCTRAQRSALSPCREFLPRKPPTWKRPSLRSGQRLPASR